MTINLKECKKYKNKYVGWIYKKMKKFSIINFMKEANYFLKTIMKKMLNKKAISTYLKFLIN